MLRGAALVCVVQLIGASTVTRAQDSQMLPSGGATVLAQRTDQSGQGSERPEKDPVKGQQSPSGQSAPAPMPDAQAGDAVAQKAVLYEEDPSDPNGKRLVQARGVPLAALTVKVTNDFFLSRLSSAEADKERNLQFLKDLAWVDIPMVYNNNRRALLLMEKGTLGDRVFAEAFKAWSQQGARQ